MLDFYEVWGREVLKKRIATTIAILLALLLIGQFLWNLFTEVPPKTIEDYAFEYVVHRFNYTPDTVEKAYFSSYQYTFAGYDIVVEKELTEIRKLRLVSFFKPTSVKKDPQNPKKVVVSGWRITGRFLGDKITNVKRQRFKVFLKVVGGKFAVEKTQ